MVFWAESPDAGPPDANPAGAASTPASTPTAAARVDAVRISPASFFDNPEYSSSTSLFRAGRSGLPKPIPVISTGVRLPWFTLPAVLIAAACSAPAHGPPSTTRTTVPAGRVVDVNPDNIRRMRGTFPAGYEVSDIAGVASPA